MRIDVTRQEFDAIINRLKGLVLKSEQKLVEQLAQRLDYQLHPSKTPKSDGWAPVKRIKPSWPDGLIQSKNKQHWSYHKPRKSKSTATTNTKVQPKKKLTADEILESLL
jgi:hypothetical protein